MEKRLHGKTRLDRDTFAPSDLRVADVRSGIEANEAVGLGPRVFFVQMQESFLY